MGSGASLHQLTTEMVIEKTKKEAPELHGQIAPFEKEWEHHLLKPTEGATFHDTVQKILETCKIDDPDHVHSTRLAKAFGVEATEEASELRKAEPVVHHHQKRISKAHTMLMAASTGITISHSKLHTDTFEKRGVTLLLFQRIRSHDHLVIMSISSI